MLRGAPAGDEVHDDREDRKDQQQVDEKAGDVQHCETANPYQDEDDREYQKHLSFFLLQSIWELAAPTRARLQEIRVLDAANRCLRR
jgi:hypothetical protein